MARPLRTLTRRLRKAEARLSHKWQLVLAFLLGGATSSIAQDPSDTLFFWAQSNGLTNAAYQALFWYWVPWLVYFILFLIAYAVARLRVTGPTFMVGFIMVLFAFSAVGSLLLPQTSSIVYVISVIIGTVVTMGTLAGLWKTVK